MVDRVVVIAGATGKLGSVVAAAFAAGGDRLALLARDGEAVDAMGRKPCRGDPSAHP